MNAINLVQRLHQHLAWVDENLVAASSALSDEQLRHEFQIRQSSIWKSLLHLDSLTSTALNMGSAKNAKKQSQ